ncbi:LOW QUALITY PROTEIN: hypothetical protein HID58_018025 [Brassica napus]|uniref:Protein kinase domain-containing protein n=1 Tax=Brassica napus TaxID=3708 RepID=A0ABQ8D8R4_BRANA|nr:LOW QUALITY PROTEIN: hypothetical protein HID58_018025 [Brassica napus]
MYETVGRYVWCLVSALGHIHANGIVHCDVKSKNVLVANGGSSVKLADFGSAMELEKPTAEKIAPRGSPLWMAPEVVSREYQGPESDVWSLGCTVIEMLTGKPAWEDHGFDSLSRIGFSNELPFIPAGVSELSRLLGQMLEARQESEMELRSASRASVSMSRPSSLLVHYRVFEEEEEIDELRVESMVSAMARISKLATIGGEAFGNLMVGLRQCFRRVRGTMGIFEFIKGRIGIKYVTGVYRVGYTDEEAMAGHKIETGHEDTVHDVQMDYYGKRVATASSDCTIKITGVSNNGASQHLATLTGHRGPVWEVAWAHPKFGSMLASCSYDGQVILWKEGSQNQWTQAHVFTDHKTSVSSIAWAPYELGLSLACGSSDGNISVFTGRGDGGWDTTKIDQAHPVGVTSVSWARPLRLGLFSGLLDPVYKLASGGCDNTVKVWKLSNGSWKMDCFPALQKHSDWVRDVAWAPNLGLPKSTIASGSQDGKVVIWTVGKEGEQWEGKVLNDFKAPVWRVSWSLTGNLLATAKHLWKKFKEVAKFEEAKEESKDASQAAGLLEKLTVEEKEEKPVEKVASAEAEKAVEEKKTKESVPSA